MTFDEQLTRAFERLSDRLRDELSRELDAAKSELRQSVDAERQAASADAEQRVRDETSVAVRQASDHADIRLAEAASAAQTAFDLLVDAVRAIDGGRTLSEVLDTLVGCAGREAARAGLFLVRDHALRYWDSTGFGPSFDASRDTELASDEAGIVGEAARTGETKRLGEGDSRAPRFAELADGAKAVAIPVAVGGQVVAVLYADSLKSSNLEARLELLARHASRSLEALTAVQTARVLTGVASAGRYTHTAPADDIVLPDDVKVETP
jgi:hypothetical protein